MYKVAVTAKAHATRPRRLLLVRSRPCSCSQAAQACNHIWPNQCRAAGTSTQPCVWWGSCHGVNKPTWQAVREQIMQIFPLRRQQHRVYWASTCHEEPGCKCSHMRTPSGSNKVERSPNRQVLLVPGCSRGRTSLVVMPCMSAAGASAWPVVDDTTEALQHLQVQTRLQKLYTFCSRYTDHSPTR